MTMRPPDSLPLILPRLMPSSCAIFRMEGDAATFLLSMASSTSSESGASTTSSGSGAGAAAGAAFLAAGLGAAAAGAAAGAPADSSDKMRWPTVMRSPDLTKILVTTPAAVDGMDATAFSFSSSSTVWSLATVSPSLTIIFTTMPESAPSPSLGSFKSIKSKGQIALTNRIFPEKYISGSGGTAKDPFARRPMIMSKRESRVTSRPWAK